LVLSWRKTATSFQAAGSVITMLHANVTADADDDMSLCVRVRTL
jgi:hypothetical protein